uniref:Purple acid phosphatase n=1 Tax=Leersia perrieri TaxID=77586 RepID=A0A0D9XP52_9ORYZ
MAMANSLALVLLVVAGAVLSLPPATLAVTSPYVRPKPRATLSLLKDDDDDTGGQTPEQVHISVVGSDKMRVTWITADDAPATVEYGTTSGQYPLSATGSTTTYSYVLYHSGKIHDVVIGPLQPNTTYFYRCSNDTSHELSFRTPPATLPFKFVIAGDLGQTGWTESTLRHISSGDDYDMLLLPGDLSYADVYQPRWDSYGRLVEPLASARPWMVTQGNHEVEKIPVIEPHPFKAYNARWRMPYDAAAASPPSGSNLYYSFDVAGGAVHVIMLGSYADYSPGSPQHTWLESDLAGIMNRTIKPAFVLALVHAPWYNTNEAHRGEGDAMRDAMEPLLRGGHVDAVFAGHVHAYERFARVYGGREDACGAVHVTIGDGGNREGLAEDYVDPQPAMSVFREASFGHGRLEVVNATHARWTWHRNDDDVAVVADEVWITSLASNPACNK